MLTFLRTHHSFEHKNGENIDGTKGLTCAYEGLLNRREGNVRLPPFVPVKPVGIGFSLPPEYKRKLIRKITVATGVNLRSYVCDPKR